MRVGGIAITPPAYKASGGVSAGIQLMKRVAGLCETHMLVMADRDEAAVEDGLPLRRVRAVNPLARLSGLLPRGLVTLFWRADFGRWLDEVRPDIVHLHNPHPPLALAAAAAACRARGVPYVITTHGFVEFDDYGAAFGAAAWQRPILDRLVRRPVAKVARGAARVLMLSPEEQPILAGMGVPDARLAIVPNGVDPFFAEPLPEARRAALVERFGLPQGRPAIFFVGNHTRNKGIDVLLQAAMRMTEPAVIVIAGGIRSPEEHRAMLADAGFDPACGRAIFTDFIDRDELKALYQSAAVFAFPSRADTLPLVILEAMASRLPVVATRVGGIPYEVTADTGILVDPGDPDGLAAALDRLCADRPLARQMGEAGRARALDLFDWTRSAEKAVAIYRELLSRA